MKISLKKVGNVVVVRNAYLLNRPTSLELKCLTDNLGMKKRYSTERDMRIWKEAVDTFFLRAIPNVARGNQYQENYQTKL